MKIYTAEERTEAQKKLPNPIVDFLLSSTLTNIYLGIQKKHRLDFRQLMLFCDIANLTLMGLEPQSALETNLHQVMHELPSEQTRELVADLNDRVFREAQRRLRENILEPSVWSEDLRKPELSAEEKIARKEYERVENMDDDDPRLQELYKKDEEAEQVRRAKEDEEEKKLEEEYEKRHAEAEKITIEAQNVDLAPQDTT